jgi:hypothetical protein
MNANKHPHEMHNASSSLEQIDAENALIIFRDPFTGEALDPDNPPPSFESQPHLKAGLDYLRNNAKNINITLMGVSHGEGAMHMDDELKKAFHEHDSIFFEGLNHDQVQRDLIWDISGGNITQPTNEQLDGFNSYDKRKMEALEGVNKPVFFADIPSDGNTFEQSISSWNSLFDKLHTKDGFYGLSSDKDVELAAARSLIATTIVREWYSIAMIGQYLQELEQANYISTNPLLLIGKIHAQTLPNKLKALGVKSTIILPKMKSESEPHTVNMPFDFVEAVGRCAIIAKL